MEEGLEYEIYSKLIRTINSYNYGISGMYTNYTTGIFLQSAY